jgi:hypothetical protein
MIKYAFWKNWIVSAVFYEISRKTKVKRGWILYETMIKYAQIQFVAHTLSGGLWMKNMH